MADIPTELRRHLVQLSALMLIAIAVFLVTREVAERTRQMNLADAAEWYRRGEEARQRGRHDVAVDALRRATATARSDRTYSLALARALEENGDRDTAERTLVALREAAPDDADVNLELARLAAESADLGDAVRYYRNALYTPSAAANADMRRAVRLELVRLLLRRGDKSRALSELLVAATDAPNELHACIELGDLFIEAGDDRRALDQFSHALQLDPKGGSALNGAGRAAFGLGNYAAAQRYLRRAAAAGAGMPELLTVTDLVVANDPIRSGLTSSERQRRLLADVRTVATRLRECSAAQQTPRAFGTITRDLGVLETTLQRRAVRDPEVLESGVELIHQAEQAAASVCGPLSALDRALVLIGQMHGADRP